MHRLVNLKTATKTTDPHLRYKVRKAKFGRAAKCKISPLLPLMVVFSFISKLRHLLWQKITEALDSRRDGSNSGAVEASSDVA